MKFAIIIPTYRRKDGKTPQFLKRCIESVISQTYKDYKLFIVGDKYENDSEILDLIPEDAWYKNLDHVPEREKYSGMRLWNIASTNACLCAFKEALSQGYNYLISLDHDDHLDQLGWNFYLMPEIASRGLLLMTQFYDFEGNPILQEDKEIPYPDLSRYEIYG